jgi:hypothetical protein
VTNNYYLGSVQGEVYGLDHTLTRFSRKFEWIQCPKQPIRGLYLSGRFIIYHWYVSCPQHGVIGQARMFSATVFVER